MRRTKSNGEKKRGGRKRLLDFPARLSNKKGRERESGVCVCWALAQTYCYANEKWMDNKRASIEREEKRREEKGPKNLTASYNVNSACFA